MGAGLRRNPRLRADNLSRRWVVEGLEGAKAAGFIL